MLKHNFNRPSTHKMGLLNFAIFLGLFAEFAPFCSFIASLFAGIACVFPVS